MKKTGNRKVIGATKVDYSGKVIQSVGEWRKSHPTGLLFDSRLEHQCYRGLENAGVEFVFKPTYLLQEKFTYAGEKIKPILMEPDFYLPQQDLIVDTKGHKTKDFLLKAKMLKFYLHTHNKKS